jgi:NADPH:quinone reductase-like Zn-dependent oxidoreductase
VPSYDKKKEVLIKVEASAVNRADLLQVGISIQF